MLPAPSPDPLIDEQMAIATSIVSGISAAIVVGNLAILVPRVVKHDRYLPSGSPLRYLAIRHWLLIASGILTAAMAVNYALYMVLLIRNRTTNFILQRGTMVVCMIPSSACITVATCQRCAIILGGNPASRTRFLYVTSIVGAVAIVGSCGFGFVALATTAAIRPPVDADAWFHLDVFPSWVVGVVAVLPVMAISGTAWSMTRSLIHRPAPVTAVGAVAVRRPAALSRATIGSVGARTWSRSITEAVSLRRAVSMLSSLTKSSTPSSAATLPESVRTAAGAGAAYGSSAFPPPPAPAHGAPSGGTGAGTVAFASTATVATTNAATTTDQLHHPHHPAHDELGDFRMHSNRVRYPVTATVTTLSVLAIVFWVIGLVSSLYVNFGPVRTTSIVLLVQALELTAECSFESLMRFTGSRSVVKRRRKSIAAAAAAARARGSKPRSASAAPAAPISRRGSIGPGPGNSATITTTTPNDEYGSEFETPSSDLSLEAVSYTGEPT
ncbi:hypothetical protein BC828DRAFT_375135 [Blastocladiella britannica]|nr:hypothetical protein BC828DRAFT_375135 [Blastocladiella britannica]